MNAITLLTQQHDELERLLAQLESVDDEARELLLEELAGRVSAHVTIEEKIFYPAVMAGQTTPPLLAALERHLALAQILADLRQLARTDAGFAAGLARLERELHEHAHGADEEWLFPRAKDALSPEKLDTLGTEMAILYDELVEPAPPGA